MGRDLTPKEWGILGTLAKTQDTFIIDDILSIYEDASNKLSLKSVPHLFYVVKQSSNIDAFDIEDLREAIIETKEFQEKGKQLLSQLFKG